MNDSAPLSQTDLATEPPPPLVAPRARSAAHAYVRQHFDGGEALFDDGIARVNWAVPWSDLMMTMFVVFAALLAMHTLHDRAKQRVEQQRPIVELQPQMERGQVAKQTVPSPEIDAEPPMQINVFARSQQAVRETNLQNAQIVLLDDQSVKVSVQGPMFFALGKADLRREAQKFLDRLALVIEQTPYDIHVVGHTDDQPISTVQFPSNWELSLVRASHVARYLIKSGGLDPSRFLVMGRGEYEPVGSGNDDRSRALNRRVEIIITHQPGKGEGGYRR